MANRITELENEIRKNQELYYNNEPAISDAEFDALCDELKDLDPENPLLTTEVGSDHTDGFKKVAHLILMGSQSKANSEAEMTEFLTNRCSPKLVLAQHKMDGLSLELNYKNGKLISAITRGDGKFGDDVTANVKKTSVPQQIENFTGAIRGEVLLSRANKNAYFADKKNCRNAASGILKHLDGRECEYLSVVVYDAKYLDEKKSFGTQEKLVEFLENNGFQVAPYKWYKNLTGAKAMEHLNAEFAAFDDLEFDIDGIVFKQNEIDMLDMNTNERPKTQIALKPAKVLKETVVTGIKWSVRNGTLTPVVQFKPVDIQGSTVKQASGYNIAFLEEMKLEIGDRVMITKFNMIIPGIMKNISKNTYNQRYV